MLNPNSVEIKFGWVDVVVGVVTIVFVQLFKVLCEMHSALNCFFVNYCTYFVFLIAYDPLFMLPFPTCMYGQVMDGSGTGLVLDKT